MASNEIKFEECMKQLEEIIDSISKETMSLEQSLKLYERGKELIAAMENQLSDAENMVDKVIEVK